MAQHRVLGLIINYEKWKISFVKQKQKTRYAIILHACDANILMDS